MLQRVHYRNFIIVVIPAIVIFTVYTYVDFGTYNLTIYNGNNKYVERDEVPETKSNRSIYILEISNSTIHNQSSGHVELNEIPETLKISPMSSNRSIYFLETSNSRLSHENSATINARQACAVESAARMNPNATVHLLYVMMDAGDYRSFLNVESNQLFKVLLKYNNVRINAVDLNEYTKGTPLEQWYRSGKLKNSKYIVEHTSDVLRYLTLWKYGGTYLDLDVVIMKSLEPLDTNFVVAESEKYAANGVMSFDSEGNGHKIVDMFVNEIKRDFRGDEWGYNGPSLVTRNLQKVCGVTNTKFMTAEKCNGFRVLESSSFYPIEWEKWHDYFVESKNNETNALMDKINNSYAIHVWNKFSFQAKILLNNDTYNIYSAVAKQFCPNVIKQSGKYF